MAKIQPKPFLAGMKLRNKAYGNERRTNMNLEKMNNQIHFPKAVSYGDIDAAFVEWVDKELEFTYDGKFLPTFKLFSNQKLSQYGQTWKHLDDKGAILMNFKTVTRENNPQKGSIYNNNGAVPGNRYYKLAQKSVLQENGTEAIEIYSMRQPTAVDIVYTVSLITNKYENLNKFNTIIHQHFKALECYLFPNGHAMMMTLNAINDESEYAIDDRKYYAQAFQIKIAAYLIEENDFKVDLVPSRLCLGIVDDGVKKTKKKTIKKANELRSEQVNEVNDTNVEIQEYNGPAKCFDNTEDEISVNKKVNISIEFTTCSHEVEFELDCDLELESVTLGNIYDYIVRINGEYISMEDPRFKLYEGDNIYIKISPENETECSTLILNCYDQNSIITNEDEPSNETNVIVQ